MAFPSEYLIDLPSADAASVSEAYYRNGWTDGLPIIPPTPERVEAALRTIRRSPTDVVALLPPRKEPATVLKLAVNTVLAGAPPESLPIVVAAVRALADERFNLYGVLTSTHNSSPLLMINGPAAQTLEIESGGVPYANRWRGTATVSRAVRLCLINLAHVEGSTFNETHGHLARYQHCFSENETASPWPSFRRDLGYAEDESTVTVIPACPPQHVDDMGSTTAAGVLRTMAGSIANAGNRNLNGPGEPWVLLGIQHAQTVARDGFSKPDAQTFLFHHARLPLDAFAPENLDSFSAEWKKLFLHAGPRSLVACAARPDDIRIVVAGGYGTHSLFVQTQIGCASVTVKVEACPPILPAA